MSERHVHEELSAWLDGELAAARSAEVEAHLESCAECAAALDALENVDHALGTLPLPDVEATRWDRLQERIAAERDAVATAPAPSRARGAAPRRRRPERWLAASAAAAALLALYLAFGRDPGSTPTPPPIARDESPVVPTPEAPAPKPPVEVAREPAPPPEASDVEGSEPSLPEPRLVPPVPDPRPATDATSLARAESAPSSAPAEPSDEELALAIELETVRDLEVIANLELLEAWLSLEEERSG
ncbi:MAG: zf-HC2 domain-containing protein [Myxococcota bacterium]